MNPNPRQKFLRISIVFGATLVFLNVQAYAGRWITPKEEYGSQWDCSYLDARLPESVHNTCTQCLSSSGSLFLFLPVDGMPANPHYEDYRARCEVEQGESSTPKSDAVGPEVTEPGSPVCPYSGDGTCDEPNLCPAGTDTEDCKTPETTSCAYSNDGTCDEPGLCPLGTDTQDCSAATKDQRTPEKTVDGRAVFKFVSRAPYKVYVKMRSSPRGSTWSNDGHGYVLDDAEEHSFQLDCEIGQKICFGAGYDSGSTSWGNGIDGNRKCESCCLTCGPDSDPPEHTWTLTDSSRKQTPSASAPTVKPRPSGGTGGTRSYQQPPFSEYSFDGQDEWECSSYNPDALYAKGRIRYSCRVTVLSHLQKPGVDKIRKFTAVACGRGDTDSLAKFSARTQATFLISQLEIRRGQQLGARRESTEIFIRDATDEYCVKTADGE